MNLEKYKWKSRILLVSTTSYNDRIYLEAKKIYQDKIPIPGVDKNSSEAVFAELEPGDAVIHDARIVHWSEGNLSEFPRRAVSYFYFSKKI